MSRAVRKAKNSPGVRPPLMTALPPYHSTPTMPTPASHSIAEGMMALARPAFME